VAGGTIGMRPNHCVQMVYELFTTILGND